MFTINRSLCEIEFENINLKNIDVDVMEYLWFKIRERFENPTNNIEIGFSEIEKGIGRYSKDSFISSIQRLNGITIITNIKSKKPSKRYKFDFTLSENKKSFKVEFDEKIFVLFDKPKSFNSYHQQNIYQFNEKYSKLFYKFLVGYKFLIGKSIFLGSDVMMKILNIHSDKPINKIQYDIFISSINKINKKTDLNVSLEKEFVEFENESEIVKYRVTINSYKGDTDMKGNDLKRETSKKKLDDEKRIDKWINYLKSEFDGKFDTTNTNKIPIVILKNKITNLPIYIDGEYRLTDLFNYFTKTPLQTLNKLNEWIVNNELSYEISWLDTYSKQYEKICLLSQSELKQRGLI